jgi:ABC-type molybdate transport system permease subunit
VDISLDEDVDTTNSVELHLLVLVLAPVTHANQVSTTGVVLLVAFGQNGVGGKSRTQAATTVRFNPGVVVD